MSEDIVVDAARLATLAQQRLVELDAFLALERQWLRRQLFYALIMAITMLVLAIVLMIDGYTLAGLLLLVSNGTSLTYNMRTFFQLHSQTRKS